MPAPVSDLLMPAPGMVWDNMDIPSISSAAVKHIQLILLGIWPVNLLTLWAQGHAWGWEATPPAVMNLWDWGAFVSFSLAVAAETGGKMFFALAEHRFKMKKAWEDGNAVGQTQGKAIGRAESRDEMAAMLSAIKVLARNHPELVPELVDEYAAQLRNGSGEKPT